MDLFGWDQIAPSEVKGAISGKLKKRLETIEATKVLKAQEGNVQATKRTRIIALKAAQRNISKYSSQALRPK